MHPAIPIVGGVVTLTLVAARIRAVIVTNSKKTPPEAFNNPAARPPPAPTAAERDKQQADLFAQIKAAPPPPRVFRRGEVIGVDVFSAPLEISTMNDVRSPREGLVTGIINMIVTDPDPKGMPADVAGKVVLATFGDKRFFIPPMLNDDGSVFAIPVMKAAVTPFPAPEGGTEGIQGTPSAAQAAGLQAQVNPTSGGGGGSDERKVDVATIITNDPAPAGDLRVLEKANASARQVGGASKNGKVEVLTADASSAEPGVWAEIRWDGDERNAPTQGFVRSKFLKR